MLNIFNKAREQKAANLLNHGNLVQKKSPE